MRGIEPTEAQAAAPRRGDGRVELAQRFRQPEPPRLVVCNHPAIEGEAIAGELLGAREEGRSWSEMAVLVRTTGSRSAAILRGLARHDIPVDAGAPGERHDAIVGVDQPDRPVGVTVSSISASTGRQWATVVIAGCVEGELPRLRAPTLSDPGLLRAGAAPDPVERRRLSLADERRLFQAACDRATHQVIGVVAAEPGVLPSRFVESWATSVPRLVRPMGPAVPHLDPTSGTAPAYPGGHLRLSASQLSTYDDCPLRFAYEYVLGARSESNVWAGLGSLVHEVLAEFLDPDDDDDGDGDGGRNLSHERLMSIAEHHWRDDIAPYRPQVEEIRRDFFSMLEGWWQAEGGNALCPEVLAVERRFEIEVGPHTLTGFIDRIDRADDGEGIRVVDYKTGRTKPNAAQLADNIQLAVYHLGATSDPSLSALGPPNQLRLLFLRDMRALDQEVTPDHASRTEERVLTTAASILREQFTPSVDADCRTCSYHRLCPLQDEGRQVAG